jgi:tRNA (uracil-5-)-methyltransferase
MFTLSFFTPFFFFFLGENPVGGLPCELEGILESPLVNGYRNKCEFSVGYSLKGKKTVGFMLGNFRYFPFP